MTFTEYLRSNNVYFDGGMGTLLQEKGLCAGELPERWNTEKPDIIKNIHLEYYKSGADVVTANTFGASLLKFGPEELPLIIKAALDNAKNARTEYGEKNKFIALDIGPSGRLLKPFGDFDFEEAVKIFGETARLGTLYGADLIIIETMNDSLETKAAILGVKENSSLPFIVSNAYGDDGKLMTGASPAAMTCLAESMGAVAIGANCSLGPASLMKVIDEILEYSSVPVIFMPNAGMPSVKNGKTVFDVNEEEFSRQMKKAVEKGVRLAGGCCGTTPSYIKALCEETKNIKPVPVKEKGFTAVSSYTHIVKFGEAPVLIGERINPTGKKRFRQAVQEKDISYILAEGVRQQEKGVHILDVNVGVPGTDENQMLQSTVKELQAVIDLPLQIDTSDIKAMESSLRCYNGKALINSVNGKRESMEAVFPLMKKYGGTAVALTLDENGIPDNAEDRVKIAEKILEKAAEYGIKKKDIIFDTLAMTVSADSRAGKNTLDALEKIKNKTGCCTSLGVSNISFGLPQREVLNSVFFSMALSRGLSAAIMNPFSGEMMKTYYTYMALSGLDENCGDYIKEAEGFAVNEIKKEKENVKAEEGKTRLQTAIIKGLKEAAADITAELLAEKEPLSIIEKEIIPALDKVGEGFENKTVYLPSLLMSAEAASSAFGVIKNKTLKENIKGREKATVLVATVKGDIHDIGKNIVKLLLNNYGFRVVDLGRDVPPEEIVKAAIEEKADIVGLSALMTTTVGAMEDTIKLLKEKYPSCKVMTGGAVLTEDYAKAIGADAYTKDAMSAVRYAEKLI